MPPASAPPIKRTRSAEHLRWEKLWHELKDEALIDLKKTKVELATSKATVQRQNSIISQQTSTITELVETMKRARSKGAAALMDLADFAEKRSPALVASIARAVASRLGTEDPGASPILRDRLPGGARGATAGHTRPCLLQRHLHELVGAAPL